MQILKADADQSRFRADGAEATVQQMQVTQADVADEVQMVTARLIQLEDEWATYQWLDQREQQQQPERQQPQQSQERQPQTPRRQTEQVWGDGLEEMLGEVVGDPTVPSDGARSEATPTPRLAADDSSQGESPREQRSSSADAYTRWWEDAGPDQASVRLDQGAASRITSCGPIGRPQLSFTKLGRTRRTSPPTCGPERVEVPPTVQSWCSTCRPVCASLRDDHIAPPKRHPLQGSLEPARVPGTPVQCRKGPREASSTLGEQTP